MSAHIGQSLAARWGSLQILQTHPNSLGPAGRLGRKYNSRQLPVGTLPRPVRNAPFGIGNGGERWNPDQVSACDKLTCCALALAAEFVAAGQTNREKAHIRRGARGTVVRENLWHILNSKRSVATQWIEKGLAGTPCNA